MKFCWLVLVLVLILRASVECDAIQKKYKVLILGAGVAGLSAGATLRSRGMEDFVILEARERYGGRVWSSVWEGNPIEYGANFIHGNDKTRRPPNPLIALAERANVHCSQDISFSVFGKQIQLNANDSINLILYYRQLYLTLFEYAGPGALDFSLEAGFNTLLAPVGIEGLPDFHRAAIYAFLANDGVVASEGSTYQDGMVTSNEDFGPDCFINDRKGYFSLFKKFAQDNKLTNKILLNSVVEKISYDSHGVQVFVKGDPVPFTAEQIIVTLPLGFLKKKTELFDPPLPASKRNAINTWRMGNLMKVWLKFDRAWWPNDFKAWFYNDGRTEKYWPSYFLNFNYPTLFPNSSIIFFFTIGEVAHRFATQPAEKTIDEVMVALENMFGSTNSRRPINMTLYDWSQDPLTYGSYSFGPVGVTDDVFHELGTAVDNKIHFAGEHTSRHYPGYVHGAFLEGKRVAKSLRF